MVLFKRVQDAADFQLNAESNFAFVLINFWFCFTIFCDWLTKPVPSCSHAFSRAWRRLRVFASSSDWFVALFESLVIGQSKYHCFWFYDAHLKTSLISIAVSRLVLLLNFLL